MSAGQRRALTPRLIQSLANRLQAGLELEVLHVELLLSILEERLEVLDPFVASDELPFGDGDVLLERRVLFHKLLYRRGVSGELSVRMYEHQTAYLLLNESELVEVAREEVHLALLGLRVGVLEHVLVLLLSLIERDLEFDNL